jgi:hypothetical protein
VEREDALGRRGVVEDEDAAAVVAAAGRLADERPAVLGPERDDGVPRAGVGEGRHGVAESRELVPGVRLVLGEELGRRARRERHALGLERGEVLGVDALVVERHDVGALGQRAQVVQPVGRAQAVRRARAHRRLVVAPGEHAQLDAERDRRLVGHPRELPGADHRHHRRRARRRWLLGAPRLGGGRVHRAHRVTTSPMPMTRDHARRTAGRRSARSSGDGSTYRSGSTKARSSRSDGTTELTDDEHATAPAPRVGEGAVEVSHPACVRVVRRCRSWRGSRQRPGACVRCRRLRRGP